MITLTMSNNRITKRVLAWLLSAICASTSHDAFAQSPVLEFSPPFSSRTPVSLTLADNDALVSSNGQTLSIGTVSETSRTISLAPAIRETFGTGSRRLILQSEFVMRADGKALIVPSYMDGDTLCPYFIFDTFTGTTTSGTYTGLIRYYSRGQSPTTLCHGGLVANPGAEQFAILPSVSSKNIYLIGYDASRTTLTASLEENTDALIFGPPVYLSSTQLVVLFNLTSTTAAPSQRLISFNLTNSQQAVVPLPQDSGYLALIKAHDSHTLFVDQSPEYGSRLSAKALFDINAQTFSTVREIEHVSFQPQLPYRDRLLADSLGQSPLYYDGYYNDCGLGNGGLNEKGGFLCVSSGTSQPWLPLQCLFPKTAYESRLTTAGLGTTSDGKLIFVVGNRVASAAFPSTTLDGFQNSCTQLTLLDTSSCRRYLRTREYSTDLFFRNSGFKRTCTMNFQLMNGSVPAPEGSVVRLYRKNSGKPRPVMARRTNNDGIVSFKIAPDDLPFKSSSFTGATFNFNGDDLLRAAEFKVRDLESEG